MLEINTWTFWLRHVLEVAATMAFTLSGVMAAARSRLDAVGVYAVAFLAAFGGGTLRDLLLDRRPFFWVAHVEYLWGVMALTTAAMLFMRQRHFAPTEKAMQLPDALGLGLFTAVGVDVSLDYQMPALVAVLLGVVTGVFGGVLRDIVRSEIPSAFSDHRPYALCAFLGGWVFWGLQTMPMPAWLALVGCVLVTAGMRLWALWANWRLPLWRVD
ncbi:trimeric intracellular cation channel family protein [Curvibacter sp. CHRR-16]|uniref:trimeric intracellular cation channel family protein n=1 Tax=Curvibacter sp. CHRR-16 TaxID=2835872 RepID=UPI001BDAEF1A|nr:trimeric intracellular cation channel family protein [Curvibacter sp. CHRR-16]MBT0569306.1 trimeric intracellular cation channel family protein [Curvibacter sp. CHRR-16]